jgi:hypothetical protein
MVGKISGVGRDRLTANGRFSLDGLAQNIALKIGSHSGARQQDLILCAGRELVTHPKMYSERPTFGIWRTRTSLLPLAR